MTGILDRIVDQGNRVKKLKLTTYFAGTFAPLAGRYNFPGHSMTLIAKATYRLQPGQPPVPVAKQPFPSGDEFYPDDEEKSGPPRYESDFAYFKPRADLLLVGKCYPPGGKPQPICAAVFRVGDKSGRLTVCGDRRWEKKLLSRTATAPQAFSSMELRYDNSFGGPGFVTNPIGKGHAALRGQQGGEIWQLPNLENPDALIQSPKDRPFPAGFAPMSAKWDTRKSKLGTYGKAYRKTRWPWFPEDFDFGYFNAANPMMQIDGFLRGDERLYFENLHPDHPKYESSLPGIRVRCFINRACPTQNTAGAFEEVPMNLDTLWVDMETQQMVLLWRGVAPVASDEFEDVADVFIMDEPLTQTPASLAACHKKFLDSQIEPVELPEEPPPEAPPPEPSPEEIAAKNEEKAKLRQQMESQMAAMYKNMGVDPAKIPPEIKAKQASMLDQMVEDDPAKAAAAHEADMQSQLHTAMGKLGLDPDNLPAMSARAHAEMARFWESQGMKPADIAANPDLAKASALLGALLPKLGHNPEDLTALIAQMKAARAKAGIPEPEEETPSEPPPLWTRQLVEHRAAQGESFENQNLSGLDLSRLTLKGLDFSGANLSQANLKDSVIADCNFTGANLTAANLTQVDAVQANLTSAALTGATLEKANLTHADLTAANLAGTSLTGAILDEALLENANLTDAVLDQASARETLFIKADLTRARLRHSQCPQADFTASTINHCDFSNSNLQEACLEKVTGKLVNVSGADVRKLRAAGAELPAANLQQVKGGESIWAQANLTGADLRHAQLGGATLTSASLERANFSAANLRSARLNKANLTGALLVHANLFQCSLEKANLTGADLSGANAYGAEFLDSILKDTIIDSSTNVKMTKLAASEA